MPPESGHQLGHVGRAQASLVGAYRAGPVEGLAPGGNSGPSSADQYPAQASPRTHRIQQPRSAGVRCLLQARARRSERSGDRQTRNGRPLASGGISAVLAVEVPVTGRQAESPARNPSPDPRDEPDQSALGRPKDPWRTSQARHRDRSNVSRKIHDPAQKPAIARLEDISARNHADGIASIDLFVVPTISFRLLYGLLILRHDRREILWLGVTTHPTAEWIARQLTEAIGWEPAPKYLIRDRDRVYGEVFARCVRAMGIRDKPTAPRSPWQNGHTERLIGSIRRECLDHVVIFGERHLRHVLLSYMQYYNGIRTHLALGKDAPLSRRVQPVGRIISTAILGGLHHRYVRI
jgi:transposase InsO family protein